MIAKRIGSLLGVLIVSTSLMACGDDAADDKETLEIIDQPLEGTVNGKPFEIVHGHARFNQTRNELSFTFQPVEGDSDCSGVFNYRDEQIIFFRDAEVGGSALTFEENITFAYHQPGETADDPGVSQNDIATEGYFEITEITDDRVVGGLVAKMGEHSVNGTFDVTKCPDPFDN